MYTILFAEDMDVVRELFCEALRRSGYRVLKLKTVPKRFRLLVATPARLIS
jgi:CheY-like chemotaxis protein